MAAEDNPADERRAGKCERCNGHGDLHRCRRCKVVYCHIHKYSDCGSPGCDGERSDPVPCPDCGGSGLGGTGAA
jgi:hypothetical protein